MCSRLQKLLLCGGPSGRGAHHDQTCNSHGPRTSRALEQSARDTTCSYGTVDIVLTTNAVDGSVDKVVDQSDDASRVAEEGASSGDLVENSVKSQTEGWVVDTERTEEAFPRAKKATEGETREVGGTGTIAEVVGPSSRRNSRSCAFHARRRTVGQVEVFEVILAKAGERRERSEVE